MKRKYEENQKNFGNNLTIDETKHIRRNLKIKNSDFMKVNNYNRTVFNELNKKNYSGVKIHFPIIQCSYTINKENEIKDKNDCNINSFDKKQTQSFNMLSQYRKKNNLIKLQKRINNNDIKFSNPFISNNISKHTNSSNYKSTSFTKREISLLDNPDSYLYFMFHTSRKAHHNKIKMKIINKDFSLNKHKEDIKKNKNEVFNQLNILHKEITFHEENKPNRKMFSTKTFMDMKINVI
jgi:hypothetical protein